MVDTRDEYQELFDVYWPAFSVGPVPDSPQPAMATARASDAASAGPTPRQGPANCMPLCYPLGAG